MADPNVCIFLVVCLLVVFIASVTSSGEVCKTKCSSPMELNCTEKGLKLSGRCCVNDSSSNSSRSIIGVDLHDCDIKELTGIFIGLNDVKYIYIEANPLKNIAVDDFKGILTLKYMSIPRELHCPGGLSAWKIEREVDNVTICEEEESFCNSTNVTCPKNSHCVDIGLAMTECLCLPDYHGYKCLNKGVFPKTIFAVGMCVSTVVISIVLWITQRRKIKTE